MRILGSLLAVGWAVSLGLMAAASAAPLDLNHVSADATWLGHVDFDAMRELGLPEEDEG